MAYSSRTPLEQAKSKKLPATKKAHLILFMFNPDKSAVKNDRTFITIVLAWYFPREHVIFALA